MKTKAFYTLLILLISATSFASDVKFKDVKAVTVSVSSDKIFNQCVTSFEGKEASIYPCGCNVSPQELAREELAKIGISEESTFDLDIKHSTNYESNTKFGKLYMINYWLYFYDLQLTCGNLSQYTKVLKDTIEQMDFRVRALVTVGE